MEAHALPKLSIEKYLELERTSDQKYEFHDGYVVAMAGGTINHGRLCGNAYSSLRDRLGSGDCEVFNSEVKVHVASAQRFFYPDATVVCGPLETSPFTEHAITNPKLVVEVLSERTAGYDRGQKFHIYRQIPTLQEYILIEQDQPAVDVFYRQPDGELWRISRTEELDGILKIRTLDLEIPLAELYARVEFPDPPSTSLPGEQA